MCVHILPGVILLRPSPPISFTVSRVSDRGGVFRVTALANSSDMTTSENAITAFIFKVEFKNEARYILQVYKFYPLSHYYVEVDIYMFIPLQSSLTDPLDLSFFSCQEVNLSLAVVNINGSSQFTSPTPICVHGGMYII